MPLDLFDPRHYALARLAADEPGAESLPPWCYTDPSFFEREVERVFKRCWNFIGRVERVPQPGDYVTFDFAGIAVIVLRDREGTVRAFANSCRHRGAKLLEDGRGNCRAIKCPYHSWVYALDGTLTGAPEMEDSKGFEKAAHGLMPIRLELWAGFMFICFDNDAPALSVQLGDLPERLAPYRFEDMRPTFRREYDLACNWKVQVENFLEYYHTPFVHLRSVYQQPVGFLGQKAGAAMVNIPPDRGTGETIFMFMGHEGSRALLHGDTGFPFAPQLEGKLSKGTYSGCIFPAGMFSCHQDCMWFLEIYPIAVNRTKVVQVGCFPKDTVARSDFEEVAQRYYKRWDRVMGEDAALLPHQQRGLENPLARPGPVCHVEDKIHRIRQMLIERVIGNR
ncbi:MAG: aromatic ring-hydroxylating dioxygenase subunit alpha [Alphaproteobacteria bacterium]